MSVKELKFKTKEADLDCEKVLDSYRMQVTDLTGTSVIYLRRDQDKLLMLYLQEHLK
jgi:hypothetical protein